MENLKENKDDVASAELYNPAFLKSLSLNVKTVIDVGVRFGTPPLYKAFPDADFILVDPQKEAEKILKVAPKKYVFKNVALGANRGTLILNEASGRSSILERTELTSGQIKARYTVDVITFDDLIDEFNPEGPFGLKIDTEGFEIEVLKGIKKHSKEIKFIICEASIKNRFVNGYRFSELIATLAANGFELFSVLNIPKRVSRFYDCLFLQRDHPLFDGKRENAQD